MALLVLTVLTCFCVILLPKLQGKKTEPQGVAQSSEAPTEEAPSSEIPTEEKTSSEALMPEVTSSEAPTKEAASSEMAVSSQEEVTSSEAPTEEPFAYVFAYEDVPEYSGIPSFKLNNNIPLFGENEKNTDTVEFYSELDELGRCGVAYANLSRETMPDAERGPIGNLRPSGWHTVKYNDLIDGNYLYNRCHLIGYQLAGENDNVKNLMTGTRYLNVQGMLPFENRIREYIESTGNHVLYRVTPVFGEENLVAYGVTMEAYSVEDDGKGICFFVFLYNVQPGIIIDYASGDSQRETEESEPFTRSNLGGGDEQTEASEDEGSEETTEYPEGAYVLNTNTHKFHYPTCDSVADMAEKNKKISSEDRDALIEKGYSPCKRCNP